jgi:hypothetical protein
LPHRVRAVRLLGRAHQLPVASRCSPEVSRTWRCRSRRALDQRPVLLGGHVTLVPVPPPGLMPGLLGPMARYRKTSA